MEQITPNQIKKAFSKIKQEMSELSQRIQTLEQENNQLKQQLKQNQTQTNSRKSKIIKLMGNKLSGKIHVPECPYAKKIAIQNLEEFEEIEQAIRLKYKKCSCIGKF